jgi:ribonuclease T2
MRRRAPTLALTLAAALASGGAARAQSFWRDLFGRPPPTTTPCVLDKCLNPARRPAPAPAGAPATGDFDFYVLALSWSPGFCDAGGAAKSPEQCAPGADLGFVTHGLWPQYQHGYPADCDPSRAVSRIALDQTRGVYPSQGLARYEWRKHGTCTGLSPEAYFAAVKAARDSIVIPEALRAPREARTIAPADLQRAFVAANPGLRAGAIAIGCRGGELEEVRLCLSKDLRRFVDCPEVARAACRAGVIAAAPVR